MNDERAVARVPVLPRDHSLKARLLTLCSGTRTMKGLSQGYTNRKTACSLLRLAAIEAIERE
jgi:hypothetical protein